MSNLLPPAAQKKVKLMYLARVVFVLSLAVIALVGAFLVALFPTFLALAAAVPRESQAELKRNAEATQSLMRAQTIVEHVLPVLSSTTTPSQYVEAALSAMPKGVPVRQISYDSEDNGSIMLSGEATRETIATFRNTFASHPIFKSVSVPTSALVGSGMMQYSLKLEIIRGEKK